jgi:glycosyltransferase involved in cell wall biosynthesis
MNSPLRLCVAIPLRNEESTLPELLRRIQLVLDHTEGGPHEIIFVDDGSTDRTFPILEQAAREDSRILVISLSRNFGHQTALTAALDHVTGDAVVVMDGDLQDAPEVIPRFIERYNEGYDVVHAQRVGRKEVWLLRLCYFVFYRVIAKLSEVYLPLDSGDFSLMSRRVVEEVRRMREHHRYLRGLRSWVGFRQIGIAVERAERHSGRSRYGLVRLLKLAADGIFAFSIVPIRAAALVGAAVTALSALYVLYALYARLIRHESPQGFTAIVVIVAFLSGVILFFLGIMGEYVGRIYEETKGRPLYVIDRVAGGKAWTQDHHPTASHAEGRFR